MSRATMVKGTHCLLNSFYRCKRIGSEITNSINCLKMPLSPRESGKFIAEKAKHVKINQEGIEKLGKELLQEINSDTLTFNNFTQTTVHPKAEDSWALDWIFVVDTLNYCFWSFENETGWTVEETTGYFALCKAINRAMKEGVDILNPKFYALITEDQISKVLRSDNNIQIPLSKERLRCLHEVGNSLLENFEGSFTNCVKKADNSAIKLLNLIIDNFKCFRDEAIYAGTKVAIYKRAQILIGDIWACYKNQGLGYFKDIDEITMFADYRIPQSLLFYHVLEYSEELANKLKSNYIFENGEEMEVEIRGCSIHAVELLKSYVKSKIEQPDQVNSVLIDHFLWDFRRKNVTKILETGIPFHKTFSIYY